MINIFSKLTDRTAELEGSDERGGGGLRTVTSPVRQVSRETRELQRWGHARVQAAQRFPGTHRNEGKRGWFC